MENRLVSLGKLKSLSRHSPHKSRLFYLPYLPKAADTVSSFSRFRSSYQHLRWMLVHLL